MLFLQLHELSSLEDFIDALSLESLPLAVAKNEVVASLVSGTGIEHKEGRQDRLGNFSSTKSWTGHALTKPVLTLGFTLRSTSGERMEEQSSIQSMWGWKQKGREGFYRGKIGGERMLQVVVAHTKWSQGWRFPCSQYTQGTKMVAEVI